MDSFNPNIKCPYCGKHNTPSVTGFGRTGLNTRGHHCPSCDNEYRLLVIVEATKEDLPTDIALSAIQRRTGWMKRRIRDRERQLVSSIEGLADELVRVEASSCGRQN